MKSVRLLALALAFVCPLSAEAQPKNQTKLPTKLPAKKSATARVDSSRAIRLNYGFPAWNKSPTQIDTASIMMREGSTGRMIQIYLEETAPDSSVFSGLYSVQWDSISQLAPEFYVPPQELLTSNQGIRKLTDMIQKNDIKRVPFILRRAKTGQQFVEIFDTKEQARAAMKAYRAERDALELQKKKIVSDSALDAEELAADAKARESAARAEADRIRLEQVEARKDVDRESAFKMLPPAEQERRRKEAAALAKEALELYQAGRYADAQAKFEKAVDLDPTTKSYYFQYGVTLYRTETYNKSLVFIALADGKDVDPAEKNFYRGLNFFRLKEYPNAIDAFKKVEEAKHPELSPSGAFYIGLIEMEQKKYNEAKGSFQRVLDTSKDPKLDESAERYIEQILAIQQFEAERAKKWTLNATIGLNYDSNVLQISDSQLDTGTASDTVGWRFLQQASLKYRPVYETDKEWAAQFDLINMYTLDESFQHDTSLRNTDPFVATLTAPYTHKGLLGGKGYKLDLVPGYEAIYMSIENNENKMILGSYLFNVLNTLIMSEKWFANYNLELRYDDSNLESSTGENDATALKVKLAWNNFVFLFGDKAKILTVDTAYTSNQAKGDNAVFDRVDAGLGYIGQMPWDLTYNAKLSYFLLNYSKNTSGRSDNSYTASFGLSRKINETYSTGLTTSYNINDSNVDANQFKRLSVLLTLSAGYVF